MSIHVRARARAESPPDRIPFAVTSISPEAREGAARVLESGWVTTGPEVAAFELEFAASVSALRAVAVSSCTDAIELSLRALRLAPGAKVLTSAMTFCGAANAILHAGLQPVLVDINTETLMPDPETTAAAAERVGGVDALVALHFAGHPAPVVELAEAAGLPLSRVIEDAAHAVGTFVDDRPVGTISAATCFSFYATKNLPIGEGGMITTNDGELADYTRVARLHGMSRDAWKRYMGGSNWRYQVEVQGLKANMTDLQAAIGRGQLLHVPRWQQRREEIARRYDRNLVDVPGVRTPAWPERGLHGWHLYVIRLQPRFPLTRDAFMTTMAERGVDCSVHFIPLHHLSFFQEVLGSGIRRQFPRADRVFRQIVSLPLHPELTDDEVDRVCEEIVTLALSGSGRPRLGAVPAMGNSGQSA